MELHDCCEQHQAELLALPNVVGVGLGTKKTDGRDTGQSCIVVFVTHKVAATALADPDRVPPAYGEHLTDVVDGDGPVLALGAPTPALSPSDHQRLYRPLKGGISGGPNLPVAGTIGVPLLYTLEGKRVGLSNAHVMAPPGWPQFVKPGLGIQQAAAFDGPAGQIGRLLDWKLTAALDAAIFELDVEADPDILGLGPYSEVVKAAVGMLVGKSGRTSGVTLGQVAATGVAVTVQYPTGPRLLTDQVALEPGMLLPGDSGSVIVELATNRICALGFAGSGSIAYATPIETVFRELGLTLAPPGRLPCEVAFAPLAGKVQVVWSWDNLRQEWQSWVPDRADYANSLKSVAPGQIIWIEVTEAQDFQGHRLQVPWNLFVFSP